MGRVSNLSDDDLAILRPLSQGLTTDVIARELNISERTLRRRVRTICNQIGVDTPIEAVVWAVRTRRI
ncbi:LuxR C-terminal-related transcriptional regulator [Aeromicrobium sp. UC242_57]|uniref:LuxR C-terminal-related transcriptional regulator n=1 Tax=Aeromicrobium sp. UC242_57 TaxID=3374624 RepID=UPI00379B0ED9